MDLPAGVYELPDGQQLAFLEREGSYDRGATSFSARSCHCIYWRADCAVFGVHADHSCDGLSGVGCCGAVGVFVESRTAALYGRESAIVVCACDKFGVCEGAYFKDCGRT